VGAHGAGDTPGAWAQVWAASASSEPSMKGVPNLALVPSAAKVRVGLDYLRWANLVRGRIERDGREIAGREVTSAFRNPAQDAFLVVTTGGWAHVGDDYWNDVEVDRIVVRSAGALSTRAFVPRTARDFFLRAGGRYVVGDWAGALEDYERVLRLIAEGTYDPETLYRHFTFDGEATIDAARAEIGFLVAMTKWRLGRASEAEEAVAGLLATDPARALQLIKRNAVALDAAERDAVRAGFWRWARGKSLQQIVDVAAPAFKFIPNGGLPAWEILFFDEPRDLDASRAVFEMLANGRSYGVRTMASLLRMRARLARAQGRHADARRDLEEALKQLETGEVDEFNRYPLKREIERLMREWSE
jgi:tetratricopeptide (TPR) repeat protein